MQSCHCDDGDLQTRKFRQWSFARSFPRFVGRLRCGSATRVIDQLIDENIQLWSSSQFVYSSPKSLSLSSICVVISFFFFLRQVCVIDPRIIIMLILSFNILNVNARRPESEEWKKENVNQIESRNKKKSPMDVEVWYLTTPLHWSRYFWLRISSNHMLRISSERIFWISFSSACLALSTWVRSFRSKMNIYM